MSNKSLLLVLSSVTLLAASIAGSGCGIMTAPVSGPAAIAENANFSFRGGLVDSHGQPLDAVLLSQNLQHHLWAPISGSRDTDEHKLRQFNRTYSVDERGSHLKLVFSRDGYANAEFNFVADEPGLVTTPSGAWPNRPGFPVVLYSKSFLGVDLASWSERVDCTDYPKSRAIDLRRDLERRDPMLQIDADAPPDRPGIFYLTLTKGTPIPKNSHGDIEPVEVNLPERITLHITGDDGGFIRIDPQLGYAPMQNSATAPASGYQRELTIERNRLRTMRTARPDSILDAHEYFYFRANGHFGKGWISWSQWFSKDDKDIQPTSFNFALFQSVKSNDPDLSTPTAASK